MIKSYVDRKSTPPPSFNVSQNSFYSLASSSRGLDTLMDQCGDVRLPGGPTSWYQRWAGRDSNHLRYRDSKSNLSTALALLSEWST